MVYGYARCSTNEKQQDIQRQIRELKQRGATDKTVYREYESGMKTNRAELAKFIDKAISDKINIICQWESGRNRSAGCAAAILEHYCHTGQTVFDSDRYRPDEMVYYSVLNALDSCQ